MYLKTDICLHRYIVP